MSITAEHGYASATSDRSLAQRREALEYANEIRMRRAQLKRDLTAGRQSLVPLVLDPPEWAHSMKVFEALMACHRVGQVKALKLLNRAGMSPAKRMAGTSARQRQALAAELGRAGL